MLYLYFLVAIIALFLFKFFVPLGKGPFKAPPRGKPNPQLDVILEDPPKSFDGISTKRPGVYRETVQYLPSELKRRAKH
jgi:hypothetical protein